MKITQDLLTVNPYSRPGTKLQRVTKIAVHYVGNPGSTAKNNRDYFESLRLNHATKVSSHYIVGLQGEIIQCIPESEWSYCTNEANGYSISIETCHPDTTGKFTAASEQSLAELVADLCKRYCLDPYKDVIRHYDVTGKHCPKWYVDHPEDWAKFRERVAALLRPAAYAVKIGMFNYEKDAREAAERMTALGFYNEIKQEGAQWSVLVYSFTNKSKADALAWVLNNQRYTVVQSR